MGYAAKLLGWVGVTAALLPLVEIPGFFGEPWNLLPPALAQSTEARMAEADWLFQQGLQQYNASQFREALQSWEQSLEIYRDIGDQVGEGASLGNLGIASRILGQYERAIDFYEQSLAIAREIGDRAGESNVLGNLGNVYGLSGQYERAIDFHEQSLVIAREIGDRAGEGATLGSLGIVYNLLGQYGQAIALYEQYLSISRESSNQFEEGRALGFLGSAYLSLGQYARAANFYEQSLTLTRQVGDQVGEVSALGNLGIVYRQLEQYDQSVELFEQALGTARTIGDRGAEGNSLGNLSGVYNDLGQYEQAIDYAEQRLALAREMGEGKGEGTTLGNLGSAYSRLGQIERALDFHRQSLTVARAVGDRIGEAQSLNDQGVALLRIGRFDQAESLLQQSIQVFESLRTNLLDDQLITIADAQQFTYINAEAGLIAQGKIAQALAITERRRARAFVLQLANRMTNRADQTAIATAPTITDIQQIARNTNSTLVTYSPIFDQALHIWVVQPSGEIAFRSVEFDGSGDAGLAINPISAIDGPVYRSASDESELGQLVADSRASIAIESTNTQPEQLRELHTLLIDPIADLLPTDPEVKVVFVPQGNLFLVPFAALQDAEGTYLIKKHTILTAPSIQIYGLANGAASATVGVNGGLPFSADNALIVGNPTMPKVWSPTASGGFAETQLTDLPGSKAEAEAIGGFLNVTPLIGPQATEARVKELLPSARLIHLATHGLLDYGDPRAYGTLDFPGAIALAPSDGEDGLLTAAEILEMDLQAELAVLSACDTGRGRITGDGVVGLSRSLITAGVPSVVVSLWAVPDAPTAELMTEFYRQLDQGQDKAQALRQAMLTTLKHHPEPKAWAAFTLMGSGN